MAKGTIDWVRQIDIAVQSIAKVDNRLYNGVAASAAFANFVAPHATTTVITITGKGVIYGGFVASQGTSSQRYDYISLIIDGVTIDIPYFLSAKAFNYTTPSDVNFYLTIYDETLFRYAMSCGFGITFESSFVVTYTEILYRTPFVGAGFMYALV